MSLDAEVGIGGLFDQFEAQFHPIEIPELDDLQNLAAESGDIEKANKITLERFEAANRLIKEISPDPWSRNSDYAYEVFAAWSTSVNNPGARVDVFEKLALLRDQLWDASEENPKILVSKTDNLPVTAYFLVTSPPAVGVETSNSKLTDRPTVSFKGNVSIKVSDQGHLTLFNEDNYVHRRFRHFDAYQLSDLKLANLGEEIEIGSFLASNLEPAKSTSVNTAQTDIPISFK